MNAKSANNNIAQKPRTQSVLKKRRLRLARTQSRRNANRLAQVLTAQQGIERVEVVDHFVNVSYDLLQITELRIEQEIIASGEQLAEYRLEKLRRAWVHYTEETELENSKITHSACCNRPPPGA